MSDKMGLRKEHEKDNVIFKSIMHMNDIEQNTVSRNLPSESSSFAILRALDEATSGACEAAMMTSNMASLWAAYCPIW
jgi:hypothetical protein